MLLKDRAKLLCVSFYLSVPVDPGVVLKVVDLPDVLLVVVVADRAPGTKYSVVVAGFFNHCSNPAKTVEEILAYGN